MKRRSALGLAASGLLWARRGAPRPEPTPAPTPTPTPTPSPEPTIIFPLHVEGHQFIDEAGRAVSLLGAVVCCGHKSENGWPLINEAALTELYNHKANWTHIRLGPFGSGGGDGDTMPDTPAFWTRVERACELGVKFGMVVEVDLIDGWVLKKALRDPSYNYYRWDGRITQRRPDRQQEQWIIDCLPHTVHYPNVVYQTSNEGFIAAPNLRPSSRDWEWGIRDIVKAHRPDKLVSTNNHQAEVERGFDYVNRHQQYPVLGPLHGKPTAVNEYGPGRPPEVWESDVHVARQHGTIMHAWRGELSDAGWQDLLDRMERLNS